MIFNKPYGVLSSFTDPDNRPVLKDYLNIKGIYSAGRLDQDSEGLLLLTEDGELIHRLTDPRFNHPKTYLVQVEGGASPEALEALRRGVTYGGYTTQPAEVDAIPEPELPERSKPVTPHGPTTWLRLTLHEGKKRQIRHMTAAVGLPTLRIVRVAIGDIELGDLQPGQWRDLTPVETGILYRMFSLPINERPHPGSGRTRYSKKWRQKH